METRVWSVYDIYFNETEYKAVNRLLKKLKGQGWDYQQMDSAHNGKYELVAQLIRGPKIIDIPPINQKQP